MLLEPVRALGIDAAGVRGLIFSLCVAALVLGLVVARSAIGAVAGLGLALAGIAAWASARERAWAAELSRQVPEAFRSLAGALAAGRTLAQAISYVGATGEGPLQREFARASLRVSCGISPTEALSELAGRAKAPGVALMVTALAVSARTGAPLQGLFMRSARLVERRFELERELAAKTAQVRLSARIVSAMPALMVAALPALPGLPRGARDAGRRGVRLRGGGARCRGAARHQAAHEGRGLSVAHRGGGACRGRVDCGPPRGRARCASGNEWVYLRLIGIASKASPLAWGREEDACTRRCGR